MASQISLYSVGTYSLVSWKPFKSLRFSRFSPSPPYIFSFRPNSLLHPNFFFSGPSSSSRKTSRSWKSLFLRSSPKPHSFNPIAEAQSKAAAANGLHVSSQASSVCLSVVISRWSFLLRTNRNNTHAYVCVKTHRGTTTPFDEIYIVPLADYSVALLLLLFLLCTLVLKDGQWDHSVGIISNDFLMVSIVLKTLKRFQARSILFNMYYGLLTTKSMVYETSLKWLLSSPWNDVLKAIRLKATFYGRLNLSHVRFKSHLGYTIIFSKEPLQAKSLIIKCLKILRCKNGPYKNYSYEWPRLLFFGIITQFDVMSWWCKVKRTQSKMLERSSYIYFAPYKTLNRVIFFSFLSRRVKCIQGMGGRKENTQNQFKNL